MLPLNVNWKQIRITLGAVVAIAVTSPFAMVLIKPRGPLYLLFFRLPKKRRFTYAPVNKPRLLRIAMGHINC